MEFSNNNPQNKSLAEIREEAYKQGREDAIEAFVEKLYKKVDENSFEVSVNNILCDVCTVGYLGDMFLELSIEMEGENG